MGTICQGGRYERGGRIGQLCGRVEGIQSRRIAGPAKASKTATRSPMQTAMMETSTTRRAEQGCARGLLREGHSDRDQDHDDQCKEEPSVKDVIGFHRRRAPSKWARTMIPSARIPLAAIGTTIDSRINRLRLK